MIGTQHLVLETARLAAWLLVLAIVFLPLERLFPISRRGTRRPMLWQDIGLYFLSGILPALLLAAPIAATAAAGQTLLPAVLRQGVATLPFWLRFAMGFAVGEIGFYWGHRWSHRWAWLWRFHELHHRPVHLDWLVNTRTHPIDFVFTRLCGLLPIYFLGLAQAGDARSGMLVLAVTIAGTVWGFFIHANLRWRLGAFERLIASPCFHHWHHSREAPINRNFASTLPVLDRMFGTLHLPAQWPARYGPADPGGASPIRNKSLNAPRKPD